MSLEMRKLTDRFDLGEVPSQVRIEHASRSDKKESTRPRVEEVALLDAFKQYQNARELPGEIRLFTYAYVIRHGQPEHRAIVSIAALSQHCVSG